MNAVRIGLLALACTLPLAAAAQWQWLDKDGRKVFSDKAPPPDIPAERILKAPKGHMVIAPVSAAPAADPAAATGGAALPKPLGKDKTLEERRKQVVSAEANKKKAEEAQVAALRSDNCERAKQAKVAFQSDARISTIDAKGERQYMSDAQRAGELKRLDEVVARDCAQ